MFVIGEAVTQVQSSKVILPKEYNLRKRGRRILGVWVGEYCLYLSDEEAPLRAKAGKDGSIIKVRVGSENQIEVPVTLDHMKVKIQGCISTIELKFTK